jgi:hypothetical protein
MDMGGQGEREVSPPSVKCGVCEKGKCQEGGRCRRVVRNGTKCGCGCWEAKRILSGPGVKHGTTTTYNKGCKCEKCMEGHAAYRKELRARRKRQG